MSNRYTLQIMLVMAVPGLCQAQAFGELNIGDVRARFYSNGRVGLSPQAGPSNFEVPLGGGASALYVGGLWIGGLNASGQVRLSRTFYDTNDDVNFFPGPLQLQWGSTDEMTSQAYDRVWSVKRSDVARHLFFFNCVADPNCSVNTEFPNGYIIPPDIASWPAMGNALSGYAQYLAPFYDYNQDGLYNAQDGDAPCILGDQALFSVFSDYLSLANGNPAMRIEVRQMPFAYGSGDPMLDQTVFLRYHLINRSNQTYSNTVIGFFNDFDLGCANDDFIGCDPSRGLSYVYNWSDFDPTCIGTVGYGAQPPAFGMMVLKGPLLDADGQANPLGNAMPEWNGQGFGDGVIDNERHGLSSFLYFNRESPNAATTDPVTPEHHYSYLRSIWKDGVPMTYGGNGYSTSPDAIPARFMFPGANDPVGAGTGGVIMPPWGETLPTPSSPDRRGVMGSGPITLEPGEHVDLLFAYVYARAGSGGAFASVAALQARVDSVRAFAQTLPIWDTPENQPYAGMCMDYATIGITEASATRPLTFYPSPADDAVCVVVPILLIGSQLTLRDAMGRVVLQQRMHADLNTIDISGLAPGVYTCESSVSNARYTGRLVKQ